MKKLRVLLITLITLVLISDLVFLILDDRGLQESEAYYQLEDPISYYPPFAVFLEHPEFAEYVQFVILCILMYLVYLIGKESYNKETGLLAAFITITTMVIINYSRTLDVIFPFTLCFMLMLYLFLKTKSFTNKKYSLIFGISIGCIGLIKQSFMLATLPFLLYGLFWILLIAKNKLLAIKNLMSSFVLGTFLMLPWVLIVIPRIITDQVEAGSYAYYTPSNNITLVNIFSYLSDVFSSMNQIYFWILSFSIFFLITSILVILLLNLKKDLKKIIKKFVFRNSALLFFILIFLTYGAGLFIFRPLEIFLVILMPLAGLIIAGTISLFDNNQADLFFLKKINMKIKKIIFFSLLFIILINGLLISYYPLEVKDYGSILGPIALDETKENYFGNAKLENNLQSILPFRLYEIKMLREIYGSKIFFEKRFYPLKVDWAFENILSEIVKDANYSRINLLIISDTTYFLKTNFDVKCEKSELLCDIGYFEEEKSIIYDQLEITDLEEKFYNFQYIILLDDPRVSKTVNLETEIFEFDEHMKIIKKDFNKFEENYKKIKDYHISGVLTASLFKNKKE